MAKEFDDKKFIQAIEDFEEPLGKKLQIAVETYQKSGSFYAVYQETGLSRKIIKQCLKQYPQFKEDWEEAEDLYLDRLEYAIYGRAMAFSDSLAKFILQNKRPERWGNQKNIQISNKYDGLTNEDIIKIADQVREERKGTPRREINTIEKDFEN